MSEGRGIPLPGSEPPPSGPPPPSRSLSFVQQRQPLLMGQPPPSVAPQPQVMWTRKKSDLEEDIMAEFYELDDRNQRRYNSILAAVIILGLLIIGGVVAGFIIVGLEVRDTRNRVKDIEHEVDSIWNAVGHNSNNHGHCKPCDCKNNETDKKLYAWISKLEYSIKAIKQKLVDIQNCTDQIKSEIVDVRNCTEQIKDDVIEVNSRTIQIKRDVDEVSECTDQIKGNVSRMSLLPASALLCEPANELRLPALTNVLISANLTSSSRFVRTSVGYNANIGEVFFRPPNLNTTQNLPIKLQIQVLISEAGGPNDDTDGTYVLTVSTSPNCQYGPGMCVDGIFSTTSRYLTTNKKFGEGNLIMTLNKVANVQGNKNVRFFVFLRSNNGNGFIATGTNSTSACASLSITVEPLTPIFAALPGS